MQSENLGCQTNLEIVRKFIDLKQQFVIDAGCGGMAFTRILLEQGARVLAIDPDPVQASLNRSGEPSSNLEFVEAGADQLPVESGTVDGVFFAYSLHHIPSELYPAVFREVRRVLRAEGFLYVIEPMTCPLNEVMRLFHNEDRQREAAQQALLDLAVPAFESVRWVTYHNDSVYDSWEHFAAHFTSQSFNTLYTEADVRRPEVQDAFEQLGGPDHRFQSPKQVMYLNGLKPEVANNTVPPAR